MFPQYGEDGTTIIGSLSRNFSGKGSKYIIQGEKSKFTKIYGTGSPLVFTEDVLSAVKVARICSAMPLFGTFLNSIPQGYDSYRLWLDKDKQLSSTQQCKKWRQYGYDLLPIITPLDPKEYSTEDIKNFLRSNS